MGKLLNDSAISVSDAVNDYKKLIECHNSWVSMYNQFMENPILNRFYEAAKEGFSDAAMQDSRIFLMKKAIGIMANYIEICEDKKGEEDVGSTYYRTEWHRLHAKIMANPKLKEIYDLVCEKNPIAARDNMQPFLVKETINMAFKYVEGHPELIKGLTEQ